MDEKNFSWQKFAVDTLELCAMWERGRDEYPEFVSTMMAYVEAYPDYAASGNATEAAIQAGYSERSARYIGSRMLTKVDICEYISEFQEEIRSKEIASAHKIKRFWSDIMKDTSQKTSDRLAASQNLARCSGLFLEKNINLEADHNTGANVHIYLPDNGRDVVDADNDVYIYLPQIDREEDFEYKEE